MQGAYVGICAHRWASARTGGYLRAQAGICALRWVSARTGGHQTLDGTMWRGRLPGRSRPFRFHPFRPA